MNILIATEAFYPDTIGGAHTYVYNLAKHLVKRGHTVCLLTLKIKKETPSEEMLDGVHIFRYNSAPTEPLVFIRRPVLSIINSYRLFNKLVRKNNFDVINFHSALPAFSISFSAKAKKIPKIYTFHSSMHKDVLIQTKEKRYLPFVLKGLILLTIKFIEKRIYKYSDKILVLSNFSKEYLVDNFKQPVSKIAIIPGGVDIATFKIPENKSAVRAKLNLPQEKIIIATARRLVTRMGLENLIYAVKNVVDKNKNVLLLIMGEGFLKSRLNEIIEKNNLEKYIKLLGAKPIEELVVFYQAADFFVLPTQFAEWFGLVTIEALACGLPVLGTPIGGTSEILRKLDEGLLFKGTSSEEIAAGIINFIDSGRNIDKRQERCRKFVIDNYSWDKIIIEIENLYESMIKLTFKDRKLFE